jgi:hypothetical protein
MSKNGKIIKFPSEEAGKKPSSKQMKGLFKEIVDYSKSEGCPVTVFTKKSKINGSNGYFTSVGDNGKPEIKVALMGKSWPKRIQLIIHEYCHYWQWREGFLGHKDDEGNIAYGRLLEGETLTPREAKKASALVRISEYDCEIRTAELFNRWNLNSVFPPCEHIKSSNTYNRHIVWSIGDDKYPGSGVFYSKYDSLADELWGNKKFNYFWDPKTPEGRAKLLAPISPEHCKILDRAAGIIRDHDGLPIKKGKRKSIAARY